MSFAGYLVEQPDGAFLALPAVASASTRAGITSLDEAGDSLAKGAAEPIAANLALVKACMRALPRIWAGEMKITDAMFPGGSPRLVEPIYKNPLLSEPFNRQLAEVVRRYVTDRLQVSVS